MVMDSSHLFVVQAQKDQAPACAAYHSLFYLPDCSIISYQIHAPGHYGIDQTHRYHCGHKFLHPLGQQVVRAADPLDGQFASTVYQFNGENEQPYAYHNYLFRPGLAKAYSREYRGMQKIAFWRNAVYDYQASSRLPTNTRLL